MHFSHQIFLEFNNFERRQDKNLQKHSYNGLVIFIFASTTASLNWPTNQCKIINQWQKFILIKLLEMLQMDDFNFLFVSFRDWLSIQIHNFKLKCVMFVGISPFVWVERISIWTLTAVLEWSKWVISLRRNKLLISSHYYP